MKWCVGGSRQAACIFDGIFIAVPLGRSGNLMSLPT
jgi:hypothetical protein